MERVEISKLPTRDFQRDYIDEFFASQPREYFIGGRKVVSASYGHCQDYPRGFWVEFED